MNLLGNKITRAAVLTGGLLFMTSTFAVSFKNDDEKFSYIVGHQIASSLKNDNLKVDRKTLVKALEDGLNGKESEIQQKDAQVFLSQYMATQQKLRGEVNSKEGSEFLKKNKEQAGVVTLPSGLQYKVISEGKGPKPKSTDTVSVDYEGTLVNGKVFDSSYQRGQPVSFPVSGVIKGWTEALQLMPEGSTWNLYIPANLAYGEQSPSPNIGPNSTLVFKVHLISIAKPTAKDDATKSSKDVAVAETKKAETKK